MSLKIIPVILQSFTCYNEKKEQELILESLSKQNMPKKG